MGEVIDKVLKDTSTKALQEKNTSSNTTKNRLKKIR